jgi:hypothetical protein
MSQCIDAGNILDKIVQICKEIQDFKIVALNPTEERSRTPFLIFERRDFMFALNRQKRAHSPQLVAAKRKSRLNGAAGWSSIIIAGHMITKNQ